MAAGSCELEAACVVTVTVKRDKVEICEKGLLTDITVMSHIFDNAI